MPKEYLKIAEEGKSEDNQEKEAWKMKMNKFSFRAYNPVERSFFKKKDNVKAIWKLENCWKKIGKLSKTSQNLDLCSKSLKRNKKNISILLFQSTWDLVWRKGLKHE